MDRPKNLVKLDPKPYSAKALKMLEFLKTYIKGQDDALPDIIDAIEIYEAGFRPRDKPIYSALLLGGSGIGKTLVAQTLARYYYGDPQAFLNVDCQLYSASHEVSRLFGAPPGYIGYDKPAILAQDNVDKYGAAAAAKKSPAADHLKQAEDTLKEIEAEVWRLINRKTMTNPNKILVSELNDIDGKIVALAVQRYRLLARIEALRLAAKDVKVERRLPAILLFDEIEKAHPILFNTLLGILDNARAPMNNGAVTELDHCIILMTSNVGSREIAKLISGNRGIGLHMDEGGTDKDKDDEIYDNAKRKAEEFFPPEFLARLDRISVFRPLPPQVIRDIFDVEVKKFEEAHLDQYYINLKISPEVKELIVREATDRPQNGARLLKHKIAKYLKRYLARLKNRAQIGLGDIIHIKLADDGKNVEFFRESVPLLEPKKDPPKGTPPPDRF